MTYTHPPYFYALALQGVIADQPSATVVPQGSLYWATDTTTLYISDGSAWNPAGGGGASSLSALHLGGDFEVFFDPTGGGVLNTCGPQVDVPSDPVTKTFGFYNTVLSVPPFTYTAGAIANFGVWSVGQVDTTHDAYDISVQILVSDAAGTNALTLGGANQANAGIVDDAANIAFGTLAVLGTTSGIDLSYDVTTGNINSAAGGLYSIMAIFNGEWD